LSDVINMSSLINHQHDSVDLVTGFQQRRRHVAMAGGPLVERGLPESAPAVGLLGANAAAVCLGTSSPTLPNSRSRLAVHTSQLKQFSGCYLETRHNPPTT